MFGFTKPEPRVARGMALLDQHCRDWLWRINTGKLDLFSTSCCVLGQLYADFGKGLHALPTLGIRTGFMPNMGDFFSAVIYPQDRLTLAWREAIEARRRRDWAVAQANEGSNGTAPPIRVRAVPTQPLTSLLRSP